MTVSEGGKTNQDSLHKSFDFVTSEISQYLWFLIPQQPGVDATHNTG